MDNVVKEELQERLKDLEFFFKQHNISYALAVDQERVGQACQTFVMSYIPDGAFVSHIVNTLAGVLAYPEMAQEVCKFIRENIDAPQTRLLN